MNGTMTRAVGTAGVYRSPIAAETSFSKTAAETAPLWMTPSGSEIFGTTVGTIDPATAIGAAIVLFPLHGPIGGIAPLIPGMARLRSPAFDAPTREAALHPRRPYEISNLDLGLGGEVAPNAYRAFKAICRWLGAPHDIVAEAVGIGRTTPYSWRRDGREPRRGTARRVFEYHAVLNSVRRELGREQFSAWLLAGEPRRRDALLAGQLEEISAAVDSVLFTGSAARPDFAWGAEDTGPVATTAEGETPRASCSSQPRCSSGPAWKAGGVEPPTPGGPDEDPR